MTAQVMILAMIAVLLAGPMIFGAGWKPATIALGVFATIAFELAWIATTL